ncbi:MAG: citrate lyase acyl carrier protein [Clostridia bacterium]|nr:citrate lyase acyl carrier protein [Clostridia bacterium]
MKIVTMAAAGTMESSDAMITIEPNDHGIELTVDSAVEKQFGPEIRRVVLDTLAEMGVEDAIVTVIDKGALNCTLRARTQTAVCRAGGAAEEKEVPQQAAPAPEKKRRWFR